VFSVSLLELRGVGPHKPTLWCAFSMLCFCVQTILLCTQGFKKALQECVSLADGPGNDFLNKLKYKFLLALLISCPPSSRT
jgi:hypothetical protein